MPSRHFLLLSASSAISDSVGCRVHRILKAIQSFPTRPPVRVLWGKFGKPRHRYARRRCSTRRDHLPQRSASHFIRFLWWKLLFVFRLTFASTRFYIRCLRASVGRPWRGDERQRGGEKGREAVGKGVVWWNRCLNAFPSARAGLINLPSDSGHACPRRVDKWNFLIKMQIGNVTIYFYAARRAGQDANVSTRCAWEKFAIWSAAAILRWPDVLLWGGQTSFHKHCPPPSWRPPESSFDENVI